MQFTAVVVVPATAPVSVPDSDPDSAAPAMDLRRRCVNMRLSPFISRSIRLGLRLSLSLSLSFSFCFGFGLGFGHGAAHTYLGPQTIINCRPHGVVRAVAQTLAPAYIGQQQNLMPTSGSYCGHQDAELPCKFYAHVWRRRGGPVL